MVRGMVWRLERDRIGMEGGMGMDITKMNTVEFEICG